MRKERGAFHKHRSNLISLADEDAVKESVWASILGLWDVVNTLTRLRPSRRERYRVSIFGSARVEPGDFRLRRNKAGGQGTG